MHWRNSNFQIAYFLAGKCHTADNAYRMLCELREERIVALNANKSGELRRQALVKKRQFLRWIMPWIGLEIEAQFQEAEVNRDVHVKLWTQCEREIAFIEKCIAVVQPMRKYKYLLDDDAHQACQREEWLLELMDRAENFVLSGGAIPYDQLDTMRAHPDWNTVLSPHIRKVSDMARAGDLSFVNGAPAFIQKLETLLIEHKKGESHG